MLRVLIQEKRKAIDQSHGVNYENARNHVNSSWKLVRSKRGEMDSLQPAINKVKSAASIQDIDRRICSMEYKIQHESMPLKEEKQLIHEIKQQKQLRKHLFSNIVSHDEIKESREQLETLEERMKKFQIRNRQTYGEGPHMKQGYIILSLGSVPPTAYCVLRTRVLGDPDMKCEQFNRELKERARDPQRKCRKS